MTLMDYVECIDLYESPYKNTWKRHTEHRVYLATLLADCVLKEKAIRRCSREICRRYKCGYRRLEDYAKSIGIIEWKGNEWIAYGKLVEEVLYYRYKSRKKQSWDRELEVRVEYPVKLTARLEQLDLIDYADSCVEGYYGEDLTSAFEKIKIGANEVLNCSDTWCNGVCKAELNYPAISVEIEDRGHVYVCGYS